jgi:hypothetical protein
MEKLLVSRARMPLLQRKRSLQEGVPQQEHWASTDLKTTKSKSPTVSYSEQTCEMSQGEIPAEGDQGHKMIEPHGRSPT